MNYEEIKLTDIPPTAGETVRVGERFFSHPQPVIVYKIANRKLRPGDVFIVQSEGDRIVRVGNSYQMEDKSLFTKFVNFYKRMRGWTDDSQ
jgi:hypothetical protein